MRLGIGEPDLCTALRRLIYCGEWIESHALHVYMLHARTFWGTRAPCRWRRTTPKRFVAGFS